MKNSVLKKGETTRLVNLLAGPRPPLPGQNPQREEDLRRMFTDHYQPVNVTEMIVIGDIAYVTVLIEVYRTQMNGLRMRVAKKSYERQCKARDALAQKDPDNDADEFPIATRDELRLSAEDRTQLDRFAAADFQMPSHKSALEEGWFAALASDMDARDAESLRLLTRDCFEAMRERDRLIDRIDRRRRQAMRDAIEWAEARQRASAFPVDMQLPVEKVFEAAPGMLPMVFEGADIDAERADASVINGYVDAARSDERVDVARAALPALAADNADPAEIDKDIFR